MLLPDAVLAICELARSDNVHEIATILAGDVHREFIAYAKACHSDANWYNVGEGARRADCPLVPEACNALKEWYSTYVKG